MIHVHELPDEAARTAMETGEFPEEIIGQEHVAVVMTQSWCIEWVHMSSWLARLESKGRPADREIQVYTLVYDQKEYFGRFKNHKEQVFGNGLIPYVRYYSRGEYVGESNYLHRGHFLARFES